jgi:hypothetical protein
MAIYGLLKEKPDVMKTLQIAATTLLLLFCSTIAAQEYNSGNVKLKITPNHPTTADTIILESYVLIPHASCPLDSSKVLIKDNDITVNAYYMMGMLTMLCESVNEIKLGNLSAGTWTLHYNIFINEYPFRLKSDSLSFTVHPNIALNAYDVQPQISVYPNPATSAISLDITELDAPVRIALFASSGQKIREYNISPTKSISLNTADLPGGIYLLRITDEFGLNRTKKIIINNP